MRIIEDISRVVDAWTVLGRVPVAIALVLLFRHLQAKAGQQRAALAVSGLAAGALAGTAWLPSILGAVVGGAIVWGVTQRVLGVRVPTAYVFTRLILAVVGIGRFGCFIAGCCFGHPTELPWAAHYGPHSFAQTLHWHLGLVRSTDAALPVHPVQLYEGVIVLLLVALLPRVRRLVENDRALALGAGAFYLLLRVALEPLRAMVNTPGSASFLGPLSLFQWGALGAALLLGLVAVRLKRVPEPLPYVAPLPPAFVLHAVWLVQAVVAVLSQASMTPFLIRLALGSLGFSLLVLVTSEWRVAVTSRPRLAMGLVASLLLLAPLVLRAADGSVDPDRHWIYDVQPRSGQLVRIGDQSSSPFALQAAHDQLVPPVPMPSSRKLSLVLYGGGGRSRVSDFGCGGPSTVWEHSVFLGGVGIEVEKKYAHWLETWQLRLGLFGDVWKRTVSERLGDAVAWRWDTDLMGTVSGWYQLDWEWVGFALGGQLALGRSSTDDPMEIALGDKGFLAPSAYLRIGPPVFGVEVGTGSIRSIEPGAVVDARSILSGHELRLGVETMRLGTPLRAMLFFGDARFNMGDGDALQLHFGASDQSNLFGSFAWTHKL